MPNEWICTVLVRDIVRWGQSRVHLQIDEVFSTVLWEKTKIYTFLKSESIGNYIVIQKNLFLLFSLVQQEVMLARQTASVQQGGIRLSVPIIVHFRC